MLGGNVLLLIAVVIVLVCLAAGIWLVWQSARLRSAAGLPQGEIVYSDTGSWQAVEKPLLSRRYGLVGRPDYLVQIRTGLRSYTIPVEVKSRRRPAQPPESHILQLATYCLLVEDVYKQRPPYGLLHYQDATLQIEFTRELRRAVLSAAEGIRRARTASTVHRQHEDAARCAGCGYRYACGEEVTG